MLDATLGFVSGSDIGISLLEGSYGISRPRIITSGRRCRVGTSRQRKSRVVRACFLETLAAVPGFGFLEKPREWFSGGEKESGSEDEASEQEETSTVEATVPTSSKGDGAWDPDEWMDLVNELGPVEEDPTSKAPEWEYPPGVDPSEFDGSRPDVGEDWNFWERARLRMEETELEERDITKETDRWRDTARELTEGSSSSEDYSEKDATPTEPSQVKSEDIPPSSAGNDAQARIEDDAERAWKSILQSDRIAESGTDLSDTANRPIEFETSPDWTVVKPERPSATEDDDKSLSSDPFDFRELAREVTIGVDFAATQKNDVTSEDSMAGAPREETSETKSSDESNGAKEVKEIPELTEPASDETAQYSSSYSPASDDLALQTSEWDPDRDWSRFDDLNREKEAQAQAAIRQRALEEAMAKKDRAVSGMSSSNSNLFFTDEDGNELTREQLEEAIREGAVFVEEDGTEVSLEELLRAEGFTGPMPEPQDLSSEPARDEPEPEPSLDYSETPTAYPKPQPASIYGSDWTGAQEALEELRQEGLEPRDPKEETAYWKSTAREVLDEVVTPDVASLPVEDVERGSEQPTADHSDLMKPSFSDTEAADAWSAWSRASVAWEQKTETMEPRNPAQEVDQWKSAAREIVPGNEITPAEDTTTKLPNETRSPEILEAGASSEANSQAWSDWQASNSQWMANIEEVSLNEGKLPSNQDSGTGTGPEGKQGISMWLDASKNISSKVQYVDQPQDTLSTDLGEPPAELISTTLSDAEAKDAWSSWNSISADWEEAKQQAEPRDPQKEVDMWRSTAREVSVPSAESETGASVTKDSPVQSVPGDLLSVTLSDEEAKDAWGSWTSVSADWAQAQEAAEPRDPKKEVDMWRSTAREVGAPATNATPESPLTGYVDDGEPNNVGERHQDEEQLQEPTPPDDESNRSPDSSFKASSVLENSTESSTVELPGIETDMFGDPLPLKPKSPQIRVPEFPSAVPDVFGTPMQREEFGRPIPDLSRQTQELPLKETARSMTQEEEKDAWGSWTSAASQWRSQVEGGSLDDEGRNIWLDSAREVAPGEVQSTQGSDWGAGLNQKRNEFASWGDWRRLQDEDDFPSVPSWWTNRSETNRASILKRPTDPSELFRSMASTMSDSTEPPVGDATKAGPADGTARQGSDGAVNFWRDAAQDIAGDAGATS